MKDKEAISQLNKEWESNTRWTGIKRPYSAQEVLKLRPTLKVEYTLARYTAKNVDTITTIKTFNSPWLFNGKSGY